MSVREIMEWTCDSCGRTNEREGYGMPRGWTYQQPSGKPIKHRCSVCEMKEKEESK